ncbi:thioredoxin family protein [Candidatus Woesearchaeota archaeon]|nr:thioredoxin family protein [Candidatus Woesearchaeota archaeon]
MVEVQILTTPGCSGCATVEKMLDKIKVKYAVIDVTKNPKILEKYPIMSAPGIVINGKLEFVGVPKEDALRKKAGKNEG